VRIHLDVAQSPDGRLSGTLGLIGRDQILAFSGNLELLARLEELTRRNTDTRNFEERKTS
jgi:hypothetical protein